ncbi:MAG: hypothetical protein M1465_00790 [Candidatus Marsarchaeota archaeon]|nr:hypothetical protein [Candidatus Marsarchaeota archaeon]
MAAKPNDAKKAKNKTSANRKGTTKSAKTNPEDAIGALNKEPSVENWKSALPVIKSSGARYYRIFYEKGLKDKDNLKKAYAVIYNASYKRLFKIPVIEMSGSKVEGATKYLIGLKINNRQ